MQNVKFCSRREGSAQARIQVVLMAKSSREPPKEKPKPLQTHVQSSPERSSSPQGSQVAGPKLALKRAELKEAALSEAWESWQGQREQMPQMGEAQGFYMDRTKVSIRRTKALFIPCRGARTDGKALVGSMAWWLQAYFELAYCPAGMVPLPDRTVHWLGEGSRHSSSLKTIATSSKFHTFQQLLREGKALNSTEAPINSERCPPPLILLAGKQRTDSEQTSVSPVLF